MRKELTLNVERMPDRQEGYDALKVAVAQMAAASEKEFETMKNEKWYHRVFDMVTFSKKNEMRVAEQIATLGQAQQILMELLLRLSENDANISQVVLENTENIRILSEHDQYLLERVKKLENKAYGICMDTDISGLADSEKRLLSALLYNLAERKKSNCFQEDFANKIWDCMGMPDVQMQDPLSALQDLDEYQSSKKKVFVCCMEYIFLGNDFDNGDYNAIYEEYSDFLDEFDFGKKTIESIKNQILKIYNLRGAEGFSYNLLSSYSDEVAESFWIEFPDEYEDSEEGQSSEEEIEEEEIEEEEIEEEYKIDKGETKIFYNKKITIYGKIICQGDLKFDHCIVIYNEYGVKSTIEMDYDSNLHITDSKIICKGLNKDSLIVGNTDQLVVTSTRFENCSFLFHCKVYKSFSLLKCNIINCFLGFINIDASHETESVIKNNVIKLDDIAVFNKACISEYGSLISISGSYSDEKRYVCFKNNYIEECSGFTQILKSNDGTMLDYLSSSSSYNIGMDIECCTFKGLSRQIRRPFVVKKCLFIECAVGLSFASMDTGDKIVENCIFEKCTQAIEVGTDVKISNCQFVSCYNYIIYVAFADWDGGVQITNCQFYDIQHNGEQNDPTYKTVNFITGDMAGGCIVLARDAGALTHENSIYNCMFDGAELNKNFLIRSINPLKKPWDCVIRIKNCMFKHCTTERESGKIIKEYVQFYRPPVRKEKSFHANQIEKCKGLENINMEGSISNDVQIKMESANGERIGFVSV